MKEKPKKQFNLMDHMALFGVGLAVLYWMLEALVYVMLADDVTFVQRLYGPGFNDLLIRILVLSFFAIFGSHAQYTINQRKVAEAAMRASEAFSIGDNPADFGSRRLGDSCGTTGFSAKAARNCACSTSIL